MTNDEVMAVILRLYEGHSLRASIKEAGYTHATFFNKINNNADLENEYVKAMQARTEILAEDVLDIADTDPDAFRAKNRIEARKWYASKLNPKKYGDRLDLNVNQTIDIGGALAEARARMLPPQDLEKNAIPDNSNISRTKVLCAPDCQSGVQVSVASNDSLDLNKGNIIDVSEDGSGSIFD